MALPGTGADLLEIARSYQPAALLMGLVELDICSILSGEGELGLSASELAGRLNLRERSLSALLEAAAALGLLEVREGRYRNTPLAARFLDRNEPEFLGVQILSQADQYRGWSEMPLAIREGRTVLPNLQGQESAGADPALHRLLLGLDRGGKSLLPRLTALLDPYLRTAQSLLDCGSGLGTFGLGWAEQYPNLEVILLDRPAVIELARGIVEQSAARDRVQMLTGDYHTVDFGREKYDITLFFQVLRTEAPTEVRHLLQKAAPALKPGGYVVIYDTWLEPDRTGPLENVFQNLTMCLMYEEGGIFTTPELVGWLNEAGLRLIEVWPVAATRPMVLHLAAHI